MTAGGPVALPLSLKETDGYSFDAVRQLLKDIRTNPVRRSALVFHCGTRLLREDGRRLGDEKWAVLEQVLVAALDCNDLDSAERCLAQLRGKFSASSHRVLRLEGMLAEAKGDYQEAVDIYEDLLRANSCSKAPRRRLIAICKAQGKKEEAMQRLHDYLLLHQADEEAQLELADIALTLCDYKRASASFEDLILTDPHQPVYLCKYAEVLYSLGGADNLRLARKYFAQSVQLNPVVANLRAVYGLWATCVYLAQHHNLRANTENTEVFKWATEQLRRLYEKHAAGRPFTGSVLAMLQATRLDKDP